MFAVIGTGRSGTRWLATLLRLHGLSVGHEHAYQPSGYYERRWLDGDVSWLAVPYLEDGIHASPVVHVIREPAACIQSMLTIGKFTRDTPWTRFARHHSPASFAYETPLERASAFWVDWNQRCARLASVTLRLEDVTRNPAPLLDALGVAAKPGVDDLPPVLNRRRRRLEPPVMLVSWADLPLVVRREAAAWGYAESS